MRALWLANQLWFFVSPKSWRNRTSSELLYKSNAIDQSERARGPIYIIKADKPPPMLAEH